MLLGSPRHLPGRPQRPNWKGTSQMVAVHYPRYEALHPPAGRGRAGAITAVALHAIVASLLISHGPTSPIIASAPIVVELLAPPVPARELERPTATPQPKPVARRPAKPIEPLMLQAAPSDSGSPAQVSSQRPSVADVAPAANAAPPAAPVPDRSPQVTEPVFNAAYLENPAPAYPALARRSGEQGKVTLRVLVSPAGRADDVQVRASSGSSRLDEAARSTVLRWTFIPAKRGNEAVAAWVLIPITFRLEG